MLRQNIFHIKWESKKKRRFSRPERRSLGLESLEDRTLLSVSPNFSESLGSVDLEIPADLSVADVVCSRNVCSQNVEAERFQNIEETARSWDDSVVSDCSTNQLADVSISSTNEFADVSDCSVISLPSETIEAFEPSDQISVQSVQVASVVGLDDYLSDSRFQNFRGTDYSIVIIDTGINASHNYFKNADGESRIVYQYDFGDGDSDASDHSGHGTNVAGIAAGNGTYGGIASDANIIALKIFTDKGAASYANLEQALQWVVANQDAYNIVSVNLSISSTNLIFNEAPDDSDYGVADEIAILKSSGVVVCAAAGNYYYQLGSRLGMTYPAVLPDVVSVAAAYDANVGARSYAGGASDYSTDVDRLCVFSNRAESTTIIAPGSRVTSAGIGSATSLTTMDGTSQATPTVAGAVAVAQQLANEFLGRSLSVDEFVSLLTSTADVIYDGDDERTNATDSELFYRRINIYQLAKAIYAMGNQTETPATTVTTALDVVDPSDGLISLREAINYAGYNGLGYAISFDPDVFSRGGTVRLAEKQLFVSKPITIDASNLVDGITIVAAPNKRIFEFCVDVNAETTRVELIRLTLTGGSTVDGGAIWNFNADLSLVDCKICENHASGSGAGIYNESSVCFVNCEISNNFAVLKGGGVCNISTATFENCEISNNKADSKGGGIANLAGTASLATATLVLRRSSLSDNFAADGGGAYNEGVLSVYNSLIIANEASNGGGGVLASGANQTTTLTNSTVAANLSYDYGGVYAARGKLSLENSIVAKNSLYAIGGSQNFDVGLYAAATWLTTYEAIGSLVSVDPLFVLAPVFDEEGYLINRSNLNLRLTLNSPAIDVGDAACLLNDGGLISYVNDESDLDGNARIVNSVVDAGAYEFQIASLAVPTITEAVPISSESLVANFVTVENADHYELRYSTNPDETDADVLSVVCYDATGKFVVAGLIPETTYYIQIRAVSDSPFLTESLWSETAEVATFPGIRTFVVDTLLDVVDDGDGLTSLREAIAFADDEDVVRFDSSLAGGTITLNGSEIPISHAISVDASSLGADSIVVSGNSLSRIFKITGGSETSGNVRLVNLTLADGRADYFGGAIYNLGRVVFESSTIRNCSAYYGGGVYNAGVFEMSGGVLEENVARLGGAVYNSGSGTSQISNASINRNQADQSGGSLFNNGGSVLLAGSVFSSNSAKYGGAIYHQKRSNDGTVGSLIIENSTFNDNSATWKGGTLYLISTSVVRDSSFVNNSSYYGGCVYNDGSTSISTSNFSNNQGSLGGVFYNASFGSARLNGVEATENKAVKNGGVFYNLGTLEVGAVESATGEIETFSAFSLNSSGQGGCVYNASGTATVDRSTFTKESGANRGGAFYNSATLTITNSSVFECGSLYGGAIYNASSLVLNACEIKENKATVNGGGIYQNGGSTTFSGGSLLANAANDGGGFYIIAGTANLCDVVIRSNVAAHNGGGIYDEADLTLDSSVVEENYAKYYGGGIYDKSTLTLQETTVERNATSNGRNQDVYHSSSRTVAVASVLSDDSDLFDDLEIDWLNPEI